MASLLYGALAQLDRVADFESVCWGFESLVLHQRKTVGISTVFLFLTFDFLCDF